MSSDLVTIPGTVAQPASAAAEPPRQAVVTPQNGAGFFFFILVNAALFVRPSEVIPALMGWEIFQVLIVLCLLASISAVLGQLTSKALEERPATTCVLGVWVAVVLSHLSHFRFTEALEHGYDFAKVVLYYLLLVGLVTTPARLRTFLFWLTLFTVLAAGLAILDHHGAIRLPRPPPPPGTTPEPEPVPGSPEDRMVGTGIFQDPNDLCVLLAVSMILGLYWLTDPRSGAARFLWLGPLALFAYGFILTQSRGGLLALLAGLGVLARMRLGWFRTLVLAAAGLPVLLILLGGRQAEISVHADTGQSRIQLWSDGMVYFRGAPLFGIGRSMFGVMSGHVAHNSYLQAFAELGFFGGLLFLGVAYAPLASLYRLGTGGRQIRQPELRRMHPYLLGVVVGWAVGMISLTLNYLMPTYTIAGLATVFLPLADAHPPVPPERFDTRLVVRLAIASVCFLIGMHIFVRLFFVG